MIFFRPYPTPKLNISNVQMVTRSFEKCKIRYKILSLGTSFDFHCQSNFFSQKFKKKKCFQNVFFTYLPHFQYDTTTLTFGVMVAVIGNGHGASNLNPE